MNYLPGIVRASFRESDRLAVHTLYEQHNSWLVGWLCRKLDCRDNALDLAHDTFARILTGRNVAGIHEPRAYLVTVARGLLINWYRRQSLEEAYLEVLAQLPEAQAPSAEYFHEVLETLHEIDAVLDCLPVPVKRAFLMAQIEGLKYQAIADRLGVSLITVKRYMKKAYIQCLSVLTV